MSFTDLDIKREYRSLSRDVVRDFYTPVLARSVLYRRAVGFFSSSALLSLTEGLKGLLLNHGRIDVVASPKLSQEDIDAIEDGYKHRDEIILDALIRELRQPEGKFEEARLNLLSNLISSGAMTIKIAFLETDGEIGMFHEKLGLMYDDSDNVIAFSGSMNESDNAFHRNYEAIDVFTSWSNDVNRVRDKESAFNAMWGDYEPGIIVQDFPQVSKAIIEKYKIADGINLGDLAIYPAAETDYAQGDGRQAEEGIPRIPQDLVLRDYQNQAISNWKDNGFRGIFDMATGTGKTYTALAAICALSDVVCGCHRLPVPTSRGTVERGHPRFRPQTNSMLFRFFPEELEGPSKDGHRWLQIRRDTSPLYRDHQRNIRELLHAGADSEASRQLPHRC